MVFEISLCAFCLKTNTFFFITSKGEGGGREKQSRLPADKTGPSILTLELLSLILAVIETSNSAFKCISFKPTSPFLYFLALMCILLVMANDQSTNLYMLGIFR